MKKYTVIGFCFLTTFLSASAAFGQGFTGPGVMQSQTVTVEQAKNLPDDSRVTLTGTIVQSTGKEKYTFRDATGDITVEIDRKVWALSGLNVGVNDKIEITGKLDKEWRKIEIDVKSVRKI